MILDCKMMNFSLRNDHFDLIGDRTYQRQQGGGEHHRLGGDNRPTAREVPDLPPVRTQPICFNWIERQLLTINDCLPPQLAAKFD